MQLREVPDINMVYKSKETEMFTRDDIIDEVRNFLRQGDIRNSETLEALKKSDQDSKEVKYAYIAYLYGDGGIGKTYLCRMIQEQIVTLSQEYQDVHRIYCDLAKGDSFVENLMDLSNLVKESFGDAEIFPTFDYAVNVYISKIGEQKRTTAEQTFSTTGVFDTAISIVSCVPGLSNVADIVTAGKNVASLLQKYRKDKKTTENFQRITHMSLEELGHRLGWYFAKDLNEYCEHRSEVRLLFILDTFEKYFYKNSKDIMVSNAFDWLFGSTGILRLLQNTFWVIAGREFIDWKQYDSESYEISFQNIKVDRPKENDVKDYLIKIGFDSPSAESIVKSTGCYPLHFGICLDLYFKLWNEHLQENQESGGSIDSCKPSKREVMAMIEMIQDSSVVSDRVLGYFNKQEKDIIFTLACLKRWNDVVLSGVVWKYSPSSFILYESLKGFSFIKKLGDVYEFQTDTLRELIIGCPNVIKRNLVSTISAKLVELKEEKEVAGMLPILLMQSLSNITLYYQVESNSWEEVISHIFTVINSLIVSHSFGTVDEVCSQFFTMLKNAGKETEANEIFEFSIWVWQYISSSIQNSLNRKDLLVQDYLQLSKDRGKKYTPMECMASLKRLLNDVSADTMTTVHKWSVQVMYNWLTYYRLYQEAYEFMQLILSRFNQDSEMNFTKYSVYRAAKMAETKLLYHSCSIYGEDSRSCHAIKIVKRDDILEKLAVLIDYMNENSQSMRVYLIDFIECYIRLAKLPYLDSANGKIIRADSYGDGAGLDFDRFFQLYKELVNVKDTAEAVNLKLLESRIADNNKNYELAIQLALQAIHLWITEYGFNIEDIDLLKQLCSRLSDSALFREFDKDRLFLAKEMESYRKIFDGILTEFCKTLDLKYHDFFSSFSNINRVLFEDEKALWLPYIFQVEELKSLRNRVVLSMLFRFCGYSHSQKSFYSTIKRPGGDLDNQPAYDDPEYYQLIDDIEIEQSLRYASNNNNFCYEMFQNLEMLYFSAEVTEKGNVAKMLVEFISNIFYDMQGVGCARTKKSGKLLYEMFNLFDREFVESTKYKVIMGMTDLEGFSSYFENFRGWIFYLDYEADILINQHMLDILYNVMVSDTFQMTEMFYKVVGKALDRFLCFDMYLEVGSNLVKFLDYAITTLKQNKAVEKAIEAWKEVLPEYKELSLFDANLRDALVRYGILNPLRSVTLDELIASGNYIEAQKYFEYSLGKGCLEFFVGKKYYEPIIFQKGREAILEGLNEVQKEIKNDRRENLRNIFRREILIEGYYTYKTREEFIHFVQESFEDFCNDITEQDFAGMESYLENIVPFLVATQDRELIRKYVFTIKPHTEHEDFHRGCRHRFLIKHYDLIKDFVDFSEVYQEDFVDKLTGSLRSCKELYNDLKGVIPEEQLDEIIIRSAGKNLDVLVMGIELFGSLVPIDSIDGPYYHWLQEIWGDKTDDMIGSRYPYIIKARELYHNKYKVIVE